MGNVTLDSTFMHYRASGTLFPFSFVSNAGTVQGTVGSNPNTWLFVFAYIRLSVTNLVVPVSTIPVVTWDDGGTNQVMYRVGCVPLSTDATLWLYALKDPTPGNKTLTISSTTSSGPELTVGAISVYNCVGYRNSGVDTGTGASNSDVASQSGNMAIVGYANAAGSTSTIDHGTQLWENHTIVYNSALGYRVSTSGLTSIGWQDAGVAWAQVKLDLLSDVFVAGAGLYVPRGSSAFTGSDENPLFENGWWSWPSGTENRFKRLSNQAVPNVIGTDCVSWASAFWLGADQYARALLTGVGTQAGGRGIGLCVRHARSPATGTYYRFVTDHGASANAVIARVVTFTTYTPLVTWDITWTNGDEFTFAAKTVGSTVVLRVYDKNRALIKEYIDSDASRILNGFAGLVLSSSMTSALVDGFECGDYDQQGALFVRRSELIPGMALTRGGF